MSCCRIQSGLAKWCLSPSTTPVSYIFSGSSFQQILLGYTCCHYLFLIMLFERFSPLFFFIIQWCFSLHCIEGNKKSLSDAMEKGVNLREQIFQLYKENYHGGLMKLVVIGGGDVFFLLFFMLVACMCSQKSLGVKEMGFCPPLLFQKMRLC